MTREGDAADGALPPGWWRFPLAVFAVGWAVLEVVVWVSSTRLAPSPLVAVLHTPHRIGPVGGWAQWDSRWYGVIATDGYWYRTGVQSPVAFFPAYPLATRLVGWVVRDTILAGTAISMASGCASFVLLYRWCLLKAPGVARGAVIAIAVYPYAWYVYGAMYADALFLAATLAAFVSLESNRPLVAGIAGVVATAARPTGAAVLAAIAVAVAMRSRQRARNKELPSLRPGMVSAVGIASWCGYLWWSFGQPLAFASVQSAPGWDQPQGWATWCKQSLLSQESRVPTLVHELAAGTTPIDHDPRTDLLTSVGLLLQASMVIVAAFTIRAVHRRFGLVYSVYTALVVALPLIGSKDFQGSGRYMIAAFPAFVVIADALARRPRLAWCAAATSGMVLIIGTSLYARGFYLS